MRCTISSILIALTFFSCQPIEHETPLTTITFGSCSRQDIDNQLWDEIVRQNPDLWIWGGDNIYGDTEDMELMKAKYDEQKNRDSYQRLLAAVPNVIGIWDDHDYGINDGGREFARKDESKDLMLEFLDAEKNDPRWSRKGGYGSYTYGPEGQRVKAILLDTRYFRDPLKKDTVDGRRINVPAEGTILGEEQWSWLENELRTTDAQINLIMSSIQVIAKDHIYEKWANFPQERERLLKLIGSINPPGVIFLSGDRHIAEFSMLSVDGLSYPLIDFTSSGLTHTWSMKEEEFNELRVARQIMELNYGLIELEWGESSVTAHLSIRGHEGKVYENYKISF